MRIESLGLTWPKGNNWAELSSLLVPTPALLGVDGAREVTLKGGNNQLRINKSISKITNSDKLHEVINSTLLDRHRLNVLALHLLDGLMYTGMSEVYKNRDK